MVVVLRWWRSQITNEFLNWIVWETFLLKRKKKHHLSSKPRANKILAISSIKNHPHPPHYSDEEEPKNEEEEEEEDAKLGARPFSDPQLAFQAAAFPRRWCGWRPGASRSLGRGRGTPPARGGSGGGVSSGGRRCRWRGGGAASPAARGAGALRGVPRGLRCLRRRGALARRGREDQVRSW